MKKIVKDIIPLVLFEIMLIFSYLTKQNSLSKAFNPEHLWIFVYMIFAACVYLAMTVKKPVIFFPVFVVCSVAEFLIVKKSLLLLAPVALFVWLYLNVVEKHNNGDLSDKKKKNIMVAVNILFFILSMAVFAAAFPLNKLGSGYTSGMRNYQAPVLAFMVYMIYSLSCKSSFPKTVAARKAVKNLIKESKKEN